MIIQGDCLAYLNQCQPYYDVIFADPPDGISLSYNEYNDRISDERYRQLVFRWVRTFCAYSSCVWLSFNTKRLLDFAAAVDKYAACYDMEFKACVQTFTFGQHNHRDWGNNHRPLWRLKHADHVLYPDNTRVPSWRQLNGDKRADPRGRVPGDVLDIPRVTGNSKQRRSYHPTQLNEKLVEQCLLLTTPPGGKVLDPFGGTGTTLRVCQRLGIECDLIELDSMYCAKLREEHPNEEFIKW